MPIVVITGGEPLRQSIGPLVLALVRSGVTVQIESNGTMPPGKQLTVALEHYRTKALLVVSPKTVSINPDCHRLAVAFKYVLDHRSVEADGLPKYALEHERGKGVARPRLGATVYLTPYDNGLGLDDADNRKNMQMVAYSCIKHGYVANLQIHKFLGVA